ncbi:hypothetical protein AB0880_22670 [Micromonospora chersina]|uniref:hypothetical protein n=1 Tax=Micromonospora chersina TaxID=47854 RepID=UPI0034539A57
MAGLLAEARMICGAPELTSIAPYAWRSRISCSAAAVSATSVISKASGRRSSRVALICLTAGAGPATAMGTSCTDERTEGQAKVVRSTLTATVSRATALATADQGDGDA